MPCSTSPPYTAATRTPPLLCAINTRTRNNTNNTNSPSDDTESTGATVAAAAAAAAHGVQIATVTVDPAGTATAAVATVTQERAPVLEMSHDGAVLPNSRHRELQRGPGSGDGDVDEGPEAEEDGEADEAAVAEEPEEEEAGEADLVVIIAISIACGVLTLVLLCVVRKVWCLRVFAHGVCISNEQVTKTEIIFTEVYASVEASRDFCEFHAVRVQWRDEIKICKR